MRTTQSTGGGNYYGHRPGIEYLVPLYQKNKMSALHKELAPRQRTTDLKFIRVYTEGDFGMVPIVNELQSAGFDDFQTPFNLDVYPVKRMVAFGISSEAVETDQIGVNKNIVPKLAKAFAKTKEQAVANFFILADQTDTAGPDGVAWASASHPLEDGSVFSNTRTTALSVTALESMVQNLKRHKSHRGDPFPYMGEVMLMVPPELEMLARRIVESTLQQNTANNDKNVVGGRVSKVHVNPYFTGTTAWGVKAAEGDEQGLCLLTRRAFRSKQDDDIIKDATVYACSEIYVPYQDNWRGFEWSTGAG